VRHAAACKGGAGSISAVSLELRHAKESRKLDFLFLHFFMFCVYYIKIYIIHK
jgi:hypothetical protein